MDAYKYLDEIQEAQVEYKHRETMQSRNEKFNRYLGKEQLF